MSRKPTKEIYVHCLVSVQNGSEEPQGFGVTLYYNEKTSIKEISNTIKAQIELLQSGAVL